MGNRTILNIYTDGGCAGNQNDKNLGGWGAVLEFGPHRKELFGSEPDTTNNRMEMTGLLKAFQAITKPDQIIHVFSDSSYLMNCFREKWYENWLKNGWKTKQKKDVGNRDLWEMLLPYLEEHDISFFRVKGHVNLDHPATDVRKLYDKFCQWNGRDFTMEDFRHITEMNNLADKLVNDGIDSIR